MFDFGVHLLKVVVAKLYAYVKSVNEEEIERFHSAKYYSQFQNTV